MSLQRQVHTEHSGKETDRKRGGGQRSVCSCLLCFPRSDTQRIVSPRSPPAPLRLLRGAILPVLVCPCPLSQCACLCRTPTGGRAPGKERKEQHTPPVPPSSPRSPPLSPTSCFLPCAAAVRFCPSFSLLQGNFLPEAEQLPREGRQAAAAARSTGKRRVEETETSNARLEAWDRQN
jgi:hypothetical protein